MSNAQTMVEAKQPNDIMQWLIAVSNVVNADSKLSPNKAIQLRLQELIDTHGSDKVWEGMKQLSTIFGITNASFIEGLFHHCPALPELIKKDVSLRCALERWFEQNSDPVNRFQKVATASLRANPVIDWQFTSPPATDEDLKPILDIIFQKREDIQ